MSSHPTDFQGPVVEALREAIERQIPASRAEVNGGGGHFSIEMTSPAFAGKRCAAFNLESEKRKVPNVRASNSRCISGRFQSSSLLPWTRIDLSPSITQAIVA